MVGSKFIIISSKKPDSSNVNEELQWLGGSLGLFNLRDKDKSCFRVFIVLLKETKTRRGLSSDQIAKQTGLTRGTVVHHLNKLMGTKIVKSEESRYFLAVKSVESLIDSIQQDVDQSLGELKKIARDLDHKLKF